MTLFGTAAPDAARAGLYVSQFYGSSIYGFKGSGKGSAICTIDGVSYVNDIASDSKGDVIDPDGGSRSIIVFHPRCGSVLGTVRDPYGQPADAVSANATTGTIAIANIFGAGGSDGSLSLCSLKNGCTKNLTNPNMHEVVGVAMSKAGDCWASAVDAAGTANLTYFKGCAGSGKTTTGFINPSYGGLDIDAGGNIVSVSAYSSQLYVYSGCRPRCKLIGGPFSMQGTSVYGHLNKASQAFAAADYQHGQIDLYSYSPTAITYEGSFNTGLTPSLQVDGVTYAPRSEQ
jgi:hypothetical protein